MVMWFSDSQYQHQADDLSLGVFDSTNTLNTIVFEVVNFVWMISASNWYCQILSITFDVVYHMFMTE